MGQARRKRASIEKLEGRLLLAAHVWTGAGDGQDWSDPLNWNGSAPAPAESGVTLVFPADANPDALFNDLNGLTVRSITFEGAYTINGNPVSLAGSIASGGFAVNWAAPITLSADATLGAGTTLAASPTPFMVTGPITGSGNVTIAAGSSVIFAASANNTYSGTTTVDGTLILDSSAPGTFVRVGTTFVPGGAAIAGNLTIEAGGTVITQTHSYQLATASNVTVNAGGTLTLGGTTDLIQGYAGDGTLDGDGTLILTGASAFTGPIGGSVSVAVGAGGTFGFGPNDAGLTTGTLSQISGELSLDNAQLPNAHVSDNFQYGSLAPALFRGWVGRLVGGGTIGSLDAQFEYVQPGGANVPPLNVLGDVTLGSGSTLQMSTDLGPTQTIVAGGTVTLGGGTFSLTDTLGSGDPRPPRGTIYTLIDNRGSQPVSGTFHNLPNGSLILSASNQWRLNYNGGDGNDVILTYLGRDTSVTVSSDANPAVFGHAVLHAAVSVDVGMPDAPLTGTITFFADGMPIGSALLDQNATATLDAAALSPGLHSITAAYSGDANEYESSTSPGALPQRVAQSTPTVMLMPPSGTGPVSVIVQQADAPGVVPGGQVTLIVDGTPMPSLALDGSGKASFDIPNLPAGEHMLTATYSGDPDFSAAATEAPAMITVVPRITVTDSAETVPSSGTGNLLFPVTLSAACTTPVTVSYSTQDASAQAGQDYVAESGTMTFAPGETSQTVPVPIIGRESWLPDLSFSLVLSSPAGATLDSGTATGTIQSADGIPAAGLMPDEFDAGQTDLVVDGTPGNDVILVRSTKVAGQVQVLVNNAVVATDSGIYRVIVYGGAGNDRITADPKLPIGVALFGGDGNDNLTGGASDDILVGGAGADTLVGGNGSNLLIGGDGADRLKGGRFGDILVGGATPYDSGRLSDLLKLESILGVWTSGAAYDARVAQISSAMPGGWNLNGSLTSDSSLRDSFAGANAHDWLVRTLTAQARLQHAARHPRGG